MNHRSPRKHPDRGLPRGGAAGCLAGVLLISGCAHPLSPSDPAPAATGGVSMAAATPAPLPHEDSFAYFREYGRLQARTVWCQSRGEPVQRTSGSKPAYMGYEQVHTYAQRRAEQVRDEFFKGRFNRSRARLPENIEQWRSQPDIANPGPDLANFPNSAFTLPKGRAYVELSPFTYYSNSRETPAQYNAEFLLRYGLTDDVELRLFGNGVSWQGGADSTWGFSPLAFDTKIQLWTEKPDYFLPAAGFEAYIQTQWLGSAAFNGGTQPSFTFNFDQSLPFDIDLEYNLGVTRVRDALGNDDWEFSFQWGLQRDLFNKDFAVFVHGFYNAMTLPRLPNARTDATNQSQTLTQNAVGAGFLWTVNQRLAVYAQTSGGTNRHTPSILSMVGLALAF